MNGSAEESRVALQDFERLVKAREQVVIDEEDLRSLALKHHFKLINLLVSQQAKLRSDDCEEEPISLVDSLKVLIQGFQDFGSFEESFVQWLSSTNLSNLPTFTMIVKARQLNKSHKEIILLKLVNQAFFKLSLSLLFEIIFLLLKNSFYVPANILSKRIQTTAAQTGFIKKVKTLSQELIRVLENNHALDLKIELIFYLSKWLTVDGLQLILEKNVDFLICSNPIRSGLILLKSYKILSRKYPKYAQPLKEKKSSVKQGIIFILRGIASEQIESLLLQDTFQNKTVLKLIAEQKRLISEVDLFINNRCYYGTQAHSKCQEGHFMQTSYFHASQRKAAHPYQFYIFRKSLYWKYYFHLLITCVISMVAQSELAELGFQIIKFASGAFDKITQNDTQGLESEYASQADQFLYNNRCSGLIIGPLLTSIIFFFFTDIALAVIKREKAVVSLSHLFILLCICVSVTSSSLVFFYFLSNVDTSLDSVPLLYQFLDLLSRDESVVMTNMIGFYFLLFMFYFIHSLRIFKYFSKLIIIVTHILVKTLPFLGLQFILLYAFSVSLSLSFPSVNNYTSAGLSYEILFSAYFGSWDWLEMTHGGNAGLKIYIGLFLVINVLIMLNLLIALMLEDYNILIKKSRPLYLQWLLEIQNLWLDDDRFGCLTFKLGPLSLLNFLFIPFLCCCGKKLNRALQIVNYVPALVIMTGVYLVRDIFGLVVRLGTVLISERKSKCNKMKRFVILTLGFPIIIVLDLLHFVRDAFSDYTCVKIQKQTHFILEPITVQEVELMLNVLCKIACKLMERDSRLLKTKIVIKRLRSALFPSLNTPSLLVHNSRQDNFIEFRRLKHFLWRNSTYIKSQLVLDPLALHSALNNAYLAYKTNSFLESKNTKKSNKYLQTEGSELVANIGQIISGGLIRDGDERIIEEEWWERRESLNYWDQ